MRVLIAVGEKDWETVVRGAVGYLPSLDALSARSADTERPTQSRSSGPQDLRAAGSYRAEILLVHVVDERPHRGYDLSVRSLLGRNPRAAQQSMAGMAEDIAGELLAQAKQMLIYSLKPGTASSEGEGPAGSEHSLEDILGSRVLTGIPEKAVVNAAVELGAGTIFVGRGGGPSRSPITVSGTVISFRRNDPGDVDGFYLEDGQRVGFPPHRARAVQDLVGEGSQVEVYAERHPEHLHALRISDVHSGTSVEAHPPPPEPKEHPPHRHLGHVARFVIDHAPCDTVLLDTP